MREDLFRGKCKVTGEWKHGDKVTEVNGSTITTYIHNRISPINFNGNSLTSGLVLYEVDPETVGQYTGLKDRNGKEIYEGDVVKGRWWKRGESHRHIGTVTFVMGAFMVRGIKQYIGMDDSLSPVYEVIGNRFDNTELLGEVRE